MIYHPKQDNKATKRQEVTGCGWITNGNITNEWEEKNQKDSR